MEARGLLGALGAGKARGETLNGRWRLVGEWRTTPNGAVCRATRRKARYVVKRLPKRFPESGLRSYPLLYLKRTIAAQRCLLHQLRIRRALGGGLFGAFHAAAHGNLNVPVDVFREGTAIYKVTRYVEPARVRGVRLTAENAHRLLDPAQLDTLLRSVAAQVALMGRAGFVHNDLKPQNVLLTERTPGVYVGCVIDCDSGFFSGEVPPPGEVVGATEYASPEMLRYLTLGEKRPELADTVGCASDVFSLGVLFYEYLTGRQPVDDEWRWPAARIVRRQPVDLSALDGRHRRIVHAMLNPDPARRPTAQDVLGMLE